MAAKKKAKKTTKKTAKRKATPKKVVVKPADAYWVSCDSAYGWVDTGLTGPLSRDEAVDRIKELITEGKATEDDITVIKGRVVKFGVSLE